MVAKKKINYRELIEHIFLSNYKPGDSEVTWTREEIFSSADALGMEPPKNPGDLIANYRFRRSMPPAIESAAPEGLVWILRLMGGSTYQFVAVAPEFQYVLPNPHLGKIKLPDATPGIISTNAKTDEQALLAKVRYNRLIDIFTGVTCYSLQSHYQTQIVMPSGNKTQVETDELYVGLDRRGAHFAFPVQAKGGKDKLSFVQIEQDYLLCEQKFPDLICRPIATQFIGSDVVAMFSFDADAAGNVVLINERHYQLVDHSDLSPHEIEEYRNSVIEEV